MKFDVKTYVRWLIRQPLARLVPTPSLSRALRTARLLDDLAYLAEAPEEMREVASKLWCAPFHVGLGSRPTTLQEALTAIEEYEWFIGSARARLARNFIRQLTLRHLDAKHWKPLIPRAPSVDGVKYQARNRVAYLNKAARKRWPIDDLSERIWEAHCALKEAGCGRASEIIAEELAKISKRGDWTRQRVESRLKPFRGREPDKWPENGWRWRYFFSFPSSLADGIPQSFEFQCELRSRKPRPSGKPRRNLGGNLGDR